MSAVQPTVVDGIRCYNPEVLSSYADYPETGFDLVDKSASANFWLCSRNRLFKQLIVDNLKPEDKTRFLEIGFGNGDLIRETMQNDKLQITASDIYLKGLKYAQKTLPGVDFIQFDVTKSEVTEKFDMIVAFDVIEHIEADVAAIANIHKMLNDGGTFLISVPLYMYLWSNLDEIVSTSAAIPRKNFWPSFETMDLR